MSTTTGRLTARQLADALQRIDARLTLLDMILQDFRAFESLGGLDTTPEIGAAWNAAHDARRALTGHRAEVEMNLAPIPAAEQGTWELVQQNID